jgi:hypothetical protein
VRRQSRKVNAERETDIASSVVSEYWKDSELNLFDKVGLIIKYQYIDYKILKCDS